ncbi:MarR family winged helix-turn-helix transcriptional regulator [Pseudaestuariivita rosea]|uniref:MarR family winged helix-turn-helix transcriptional regulator n=1 Tax=Pseudaestuariivita rosea TaxID=2763263 RepID=UPI001ABAF35E|nr:MarR family transcriptional regulator [Pseudaestuariivita rosea]
MEKQDLSNKNMHLVEDDVLGLAQADLTERVAEAMRAVSRAYVASVVSALAEHGFVGLTPATITLLAQLPEHGAQTVTLARANRRTKQATGKLVAELEANGYVKRVPDPGDGRAMLVRPTKKGANALRIGADAKIALAERTLSVLGQDELTRLYANLDQLERMFKDAERG